MYNGSTKGHTLKSKVHFAESKKMKKILLSSAGATALGITTLIGAGGALAADGDLTQTDTVVVTVDSSCSLASSGSGLSPASAYSVNLANGEFDDDIEGSTFTITCNDTGGWKLTAVGYTNEVEGTTYMDASTNVSEDDIQTGTTLDGTVSDWAVQFDKGGTDASHTNVLYGYNTFAVIPDSTTVVATGSSTAGNATVTATYGIGISPTQSAGTYTGKVLYTLAHPITETNNSNQSNDNSGTDGGEQQSSDNSGTGSDAQQGGGTTDGGKSGGDSTDSGKSGSDSKGGDSGAKSGDTNTTNTTNNVTNNNVSNYYSNLLTNSTTNNTTSGGGYSGGGYSGDSNDDNTFATLDEPDTSNEDEKKDDEEETDDNYEAPLGVTTSSSDNSSDNSGMETGFLVALGAAGVAGVATYALIRKQDSEE